MEAVGGHKKGFKLLRSNSKAIAHKTRMGFNLIEAAMVLAVVGGVIGTIWAVANNVRENYKINQLTDGLIFASSNLQNNLSSSDLDAMPRDVSGYYHLTNYCISAKVFPESFYRNNKLFTPFDGDDFMASQQNNGNIVCEAQGPYIEIDFVVPTESICLKMTNAITKRFKDNTSLENIQVFGFDSNVTSAPTTYINWPLPLSGTHCKAEYPANIRLRFNPLRVSN